MMWILVSVGLFVAFGCKESPQPSPTETTGIAAPAAPVIDAPRPLLVSPEAPPSEAVPAERAASEAEKSSDEDAPYDPHKAREDALRKARGLLNRL